MGCFNSVPRCKECGHTMIRSRTGTIVYKKYTSGHPRLTHHYECNNCIWNRNENDARQMLEAIRTSIDHSIEHKVALI